MHRVTTGCLVLALAAAWPGAAAPDVRPRPAASPAQAWERAAEALLARRAAAVQAGDERAFARTMAGAPKSFARARAAWFRSIRGLPLRTYRLERDPNGFGDLAPALRRRKGFDEIHGLEVIERVGLRGYDRDPTAERLYLTVARRSTRWSVIADDDLDDLGLRSSRDLPDFGGVRRMERDGVMVVFHPGSESRARRILSATVAAARRVSGAWPYDWPGRVVVNVPRNERELARILQADFDLGPFVAFASSSVDRTGGWRLTGHRVYVQPATYFRQPESLRDDILGHEVLHIATRGSASSFTPTWLDEGVAQVYGEESPVATGNLRALVRRQGGLPDDAVFVVGSGSEIQAAYGAAYRFVAGLKSGGPRLYRALGRRNPVSAGTWRYHLDRAAREALGTSFRRLERDWVERIL